MINPLFLLIVFVSCVFQGLVGFGFALVAVPISLIFMSPDFVIPAMTIVSLPLNILLIYSIKQPLNKKFVAGLIMFGILGMPIGLFVLNIFTPWQIKLFAAIISISTALISTVKFVSFPKSLWVDRFAGFLAGILTTSINVNGAPIAALLLIRNIKRDSFRRTLAVYFAIMSILSLFFFGYKLIPLLSNPISIILIVITAVVGGFVGNRLSRFVPSGFHKVIALGVISLAGIYSLL